MVTETGDASLKVTVKSDLEIVLTRVFNAPRMLVFEAHSKCEHLEHWWGRRGSTLACEMDFRPGGSYRFVSKEPDGAEYAFRGEFREIVAPELLVYSFEFEPMPGHVSVDSIVFEEQDGKTTVICTTSFASIEDRDGMLQSGMEAGAAESYDRLEELLRTLS
ncbi:MAG TPA: SRPBCC family protein [Dehalococcoidia bacterium]|nr:SRPBCC family protein [Dehalococcoidia bacterium]